MATTPNATRAATRTSAEASQQGASEKDLTSKGTIIGLAIAALFVGICISTPDRPKTTPAEVAAFAADQKRVCTDALKQPIIQSKVIQKIEHRFAGYVDVYVTRMWDVAPLDSRKGVGMYLSICETGVRSNVTFLDGNTGKELAMYLEGGAYVSRE